MVKIYACLVGNWVCLNDDPDCKMGTHKTSPLLWWEENAEVWSPFKREKENSLYDLNYVNVIYRQSQYRINPLFIQIVSY